MADQAQSLVFFVAGIIGFGPAIGVLYHALRTYDYPFTEKAYFDTSRVVLGLAVGMVLGTVSGAITVGLRATILTLLSLVVLLVLLATFEEGFKLVYLNRKGYRKRFDTTFVAVGLSMGMAAIAAAGSAYTNGPTLFLPDVAIPLFAFSVSLAFVHGATGAIIGLGCARAEIVVPFSQALVGRVIHAGLLVPFFVWSALPAGTSIAIPAFSLAAAIVFSALLYAHAYRTVIPATLPQDLRRERRRKARRERRAEE